MSSETIGNFLDPETLSGIDNYQLLARIVVESFTAGLHRSVSHGFGSEFMQYRDYTPGDDLKYVDWKLFGRQNRVYTKVFREETNFNCHIILDASGSMAYKGQNSPVSKFRYASMLSACFAYLASKQGDSTGLYIYNDKCLSLVKPSSTPSHLNRIFAELTKAKPEGKADHFHYLPRFAELTSKRGIVIFISDFLDESPNVPEFISKLRFANHDCIAVQVIDRDELELPFRGTGRFFDAENDSQIITCPSSIRKEYQKRFNEFIDGVKKQCITKNIDYIRTVSDTNLGETLSAYLNKRESKKC